LILYFFKAAGKTFQQGSSKVTRKDLAARLADSLALALALALATLLSGLSKLSVLLAEIGLAGKSDDEDEEDGAKEGLRVDLLGAEDVAEESELEGDD
jgi:hypothetical protein